MEQEAPGAGPSGEEESTRDDEWGMEQLISWLQGSIPETPRLAGLLPASPVLWKGTFRRSAVSVLKVKDAPDPARSLRDLWEELRHDSVVRLLGWTAINREPVLLLEPLQMTLDHFIYETPSGGARARDVMARIALGVADGLAFLHERKVLHRALRPEAIFLTAALEAKVGDFGLAKRWAEGGNNTPETGVYRYMAPEVVSHAPYDEKCDVYSYGMTIYELLHRRQPFTGINGVQAAYLVVTARQRPALDLPPELIMFGPALCASWAHDAAARPSFPQLIDRIMGTLLSSIFTATPKATDGPTPDGPPHFALATSGFAATAASAAAKDAANSAANKAAKAATATAATKAAATAAATAAAPRGGASYVSPIASRDMSPTPLSPTPSSPSAAPPAPSIGHAPAAPAAALPGPSPPTMPGAPTASVSPSPSLKRSGTDAAALQWESPSGKCSAHESPDLLRDARRLFEQRLSALATQVHLASHPGT